MNPSQLIDKQIADTPDWRGEMLKQLRKLIHEAEPEIEEQWKWGTAVFAYKGNVCAIAAFKNHVKINFFKGPSLSDPRKLINSGLDAKNTRSIDFSEADILDEGKLKDLIKEAVALNS